MRRVPCRRYGTAKRERLEGFPDNALHSQHFARYIGERCRTSTINDVAVDLTFA